MNEIDWDKAWNVLGQSTKAFYLMFGAEGLTELLGVRVESSRVAVEFEEFSKMMDGLEKRPAIEENGDE